MSCPILYRYFDTSEIHLISRFHEGARWVSFSVSAFLEPVRSPSAHLFHFL